jgi:D-arabinose 1-dehydrogenase-like Zn-dependent alcohol dehydrogenase
LTAPAAGYPSPIQTQETHHARLGRGREWQPLQELELPTPEPKGTEVLIEVTHCGVCHSDLHIWEGYYDRAAASTCR